MFNALLSGRVFGLPSNYSNGAVEFARAWSRQSDLKPQPNGGIYWGELTRIKNAGYEWHDALPPADVNVRHGLVPLGSSNSVDFFAFICPLPSLSVTFKSAAVSYFRKQRELAVTTEISVDLTSLVAKGWTSASPQITAYEGFDYQNALVAIAPSDKSVVPSMKEVLSIEFRVSDTVAKVDNNFDVRVADVSADFSKVASSLVAVFDICLKHGILSFTPASLHR